MMTTSEYHTGTVKGFTIAKGSSFITATHTANTVFGCYTGIERDVFRSLKQTPEMACPA